MKKVLSILLSASVLFAGEASACTIITATKGKTVYFAGNEDQSPNASYLVVDKTGKYGVVFFATPAPTGFATSTANPSLIMQMGVNEMGLSYDINTIGKETLVHVPNSVKQTEWALVKLMRETGSVKELLDKIFLYDWGPSIAYQIHVADRSGDAAVIHPGKDGKLTFTRIDRKKGYLVSTNFNVRDTGLLSWSSPRYQTADSKLKAITTEGELSQKSVAAILQATHQEADWINPSKTIYSVVVNLNTLDIALYTDGKFDKAYSLNVLSELTKASGKQTVPLADVIAAKAQADRVH
jgi:hypothetical protein